MTTVINASEAEIGTVDRSSDDDDDDDDDDDLRILYHERCFQLSGGRGGELASCCTLFKKSHWRLN
jgi:hypothetical protein